LITGQGGSAGGGAGSGTSIRLIVQIRTHLGPIAEPQVHMTGPTEALCSDRGNPLGKNTRNIFLCVKEATESGQELVVGKIYYTRGKP
jgi:hypothetical protein